ncbi:hypothetical protein B0H10DRAFT_630220 [Mycena sp. CBHHK59/15]|nr:hypothetical protein B0H10DRAFT_630220 [Mycena sp. CBHHK59/15]
MTTSVGRCTLPPFNCSFRQLLLGRKDRPRSFTFSAVDVGSSFFFASTSNTIMTMSLETIIFIPLLLMTFSRRSAGLPVLQRGDSSVSLSGGVTSTMVAPGGQMFGSYFQIGISSTTLLSSLDGTSVTITQKISSVVTPSFPQSSEPVSLNATAISSSGLSSTGTGISPTITSAQDTLNPTAVTPTATSLRSSADFPLNTTFGVNIHGSESGTETLSPTTNIFTTTSYSIFTSDGQIKSTPIPAISTSVTWVPVSTQTSRALNKSPGPSVSVRIGAAIGGVSVFLLILLVYIIKRRRNLRKHAFMHLGGI